jgi:hypothetical protein
MSGGQCVECNYNIVSAKIETEIISFCGRITAMEAAASLKEELKLFIDSTQVCLDQVKSLLGSTSNPSDDTSLAVRLSMVKVSVNIHKCYSEYVWSIVPAIFP